MFKFEPFKAGVTTLILASGIVFGPCQAAPFCLLQRTWPAKSVLHRSADQTGDVKLQATLEGHKGQIAALAFSPDGKKLASSGDSTRIWDINDKKCIAVLDKPGGGVTHVRYSPDGQIIATACWTGYMINLWDANTGMFLATLRSHTSEIIGIAFSSNGKTFLSGSRDGAINIWDSTQWKLRRSVPTKMEHLRPSMKSTMHSLALSADGRTVATGYGDGTIKLWEVSTLKLRATLQGHFNEASAWQKRFGNPIMSLAFGSRDKLLASIASENEVLKVWDPTKGNESQVLKGRTIITLCVLFSPDGKTLASGSEEKTIRLWDIASPANGPTVIKQGAIVNALAFSPDGHFLASGGLDSVIRLWLVPLTKYAK